VQDLPGLLHGDRGDQIKKALLLGLCPFAIAAFVSYAEPTQETYAGISRVSRDLSQLRDQHSPVYFNVPMASARTFFVVSYQFSCFLGPAKQMTLAYTFGFAHTAGFRN